jgi:hypothetical protein
MGILDIVPAGVVTGKNLLKVFEYGKLDFTLDLYAFYSSPTPYSSRT